MAYVLLLNASACVMGCFPPWYSILCIQYICEIFIQDGRTALMVASNEGHLECVKALLKCGAQANTWECGTVGESE